MHVAEEDRPAVRKYHEFIMVDCVLILKDNCITAIAPPEGCSFDEFYSIKSKAAKVLEARADELQQARNLLGDWLAADADTDNATRCPRFIAAVRHTRRFLGMDTDFPQT